MLRNKIYSVYQESDIGFTWVFSVTTPQIGSVVAHALDTSWGCETLGAVTDAPAWKAAAPGLLTAPPLQSHSAPCSLPKLPAGAAPGPKGLPEDDQRGLVLGDELSPSEVQQSDRNVQRKASHVGGRAAERSLWAESCSSLDLGGKSPLLSVLSHSNHPAAAPPGQEASCPPRLLHARIIH